MKFNIVFEEKKTKKKLFYTQADYSFFTEPSITTIDYTLTINYLVLSVAHQKIFDLNGYCPRKSWITKELVIPQFKSGSLRVAKDLQSGLSYDLAKNWQIYIDPKSQWICIGDFELEDIVCVEFIINCVAALKNNELVALWLNPEFV